MYWRCFNSVTTRCNLISTRSNGKSVQLSFERYKITRPMPSLPWQICCRRPSESRQSSPNRALKRLLKVSKAVSHSEVFMTAQILLSFEPLGTQSASVHDSVPMSLTSSLMAARVVILPLCELGVKRMMSAVHEVVKKNTDHGCRQWANQVIVEKTIATTSREWGPKSGRRP